MERGGEVGRWWVQWQSLIHPIFTVSPSTTHSSTSALTS